MCDVSVQYYFSPDFLSDLVLSSERKLYIVGYFNINIDAVLAKGFGLRLNRKWRGGAVGSEALVGEAA